MILLILLVLGLCLGSFVNAYVWRVHQQAAAKTKRQKQAQDLSVLHGRSMCPQCRHQLAPADLIPVASWLLLKGKCRYCHKPVSPQYPAVELLTALLFAVSYWSWPEPLQGLQWLAFALWLGIVVNLVALMVYDFKWMLLPNRMLIPLLGLTAGFVGAQVAITGSVEPLIGSVIGALIGGGLFYVLFQISGGRWIGGGDVKLGAVLGVITGGPMNAILLLFLASLIGTIIALPLMMTGRATRTSKLPFGPFLIAGAFIATLYGERLVSWYNQLIGL